MRCARSCGRVDAVLEVSSQRARKRRGTMNAGRSSIDRSVRPHDLKL